MNRGRKSEVRYAASLMIAASAILPGFTACGKAIPGSAAQGGSPTSVMVSCTPATVAPGATSQCSATTQGGSSAVVWAATAGAVSSSGVFTAPLSPGQVTVKATSLESSEVAGTAAITVAYLFAPSRHVVVVMEENQGYSSVVGNTTDWPFLNTLIGKGALPTNYYANTHPSIGNYFMLTAGQILTNDDSSTQVWNVDNIARRMLSSGVSFKVYAEGITQGYTGGDTGLYVIRHNPFAMLADVSGNAQVAGQVMCPFSQFASDVKSDTLPEFSFIVPNIDDDAHSGTPLQADTWLQAQIASRLSDLQEFQPGGDGLLILDFDEAADSDATNGGGHVAPVLWGPTVKAGYQQTSATVYQHQDMLLTIMNALGLSNPPGASAGAQPMGEFFVQP